MSIFGLNEWEGIFKQFFIKDTTTINTFWYLNSSFSSRPVEIFNKGYSCYWLSAILKGMLKSFQHFLWMALTTCLISLMCALWSKCPNGSEWKLGQVRIILPTPLLLVPLENTNNLYCVSMLLTRWSGVL